MSNIDYRDVILRNYQRESKYLNAYLTAIRKNIFEGKSNPDGLVNLDLQEELINPQLDTINTSTMGLFDYDLEAQRLLSSLVKNDNTGEKMSRIVDVLKANQNEYPQLLVLNWKQVQSDIMSQFSSKTNQSEQVLVDFLNARLSKLYKEQQLNTKVSLPQQPAPYQPVQPVQVVQTLLHLHLHLKHQLLHQKEQPQLAHHKRPQFQQDQALPRITRISYAKQSRNKTRYNGFRNYVS